MTISGTVEPDMNGDYYPAGVDGNGKMRYMLGAIAYSQNVSRIESNGTQWLLVAADFGGDTIGTWASNEPPHPTTPATATTWTPNGSEDGTPVITAGTVFVTEVDLESPISALPALPTATAPSAILS